MVKAVKVKDQGQAVADPGEMYQALLLRVIEDTRCLRSLIDDLQDAGRLTGRLTLPGAGGARSVADGIDRAVRMWRASIPDVMGIPPVDPAAERVREAQVMVDRQRRFLDWAVL